MIKKRRPPKLSLNLEDDHPTVSAIAPLLCFASTFVVLVLFRLVVTFGAVTARCVDTDQFWYTPAGGDWPLVASFFLVFFLLFVWSVVIAIDDWRQSTGTKIMIVVSIVAVSICLYTFRSLHDRAYFEYHERNGYYENIKFSTGLIWTREIESECATYQRFSGRWEVVDREVGNYGFDIPARWIELHPWGEIHAGGHRWEEASEGWWQPPSLFRGSNDKVWREGYIWAGGPRRFDAPWDFELQGDVLILTTPRYFNEWEKSRITLKRAEQSSQKLFH